ncbi:MAG: ATP-binding protein [Clostridiales bacterium]|nr:ATP-binding protein [Clostridiales bacterium]
MKKKSLTIGIDDFRRVREDDRYYVDKSLMIRDFMEQDDQVTLITRPRRFGKTLNMMMIREFFDITKDSRAIFEGLAIMDTEYAAQINTRPVVFLTMKDCDADTAESLCRMLAENIFKEYLRYTTLFENKVDPQNLYYVKIYMLLNKMLKETVTLDDLVYSMYYLMMAVTTFYGKKPLLLIDEYDAPILSAYEHGYRKKMGSFFSTFYGVTFKGNEYLDCALLTGIQRIAKESIFSRLNNLRVYTVLNERYSEYFGLTGEETEQLLTDYDLELNDEVKRQYNGYLFGGTEIYNPWSVLNYAESGSLQPYWINTSTNALIRESIAGADAFFRKSYERLLKFGESSVYINLETAFAELKDEHTLWGLLVNAGYLTVTESDAIRSEVTVKIPNGEVRSEFIRIVSHLGHMGDSSLTKMFECLFARKMDEFLELYQHMVLESASYYDAKENAYHMLFLGMCLSLTGLYKVTSNLENGDGRSDIKLESLTAGRVHMIIEFKQGEDIAKLKKEALQQILDNQYYAGLQGEVLCLGVAHNKKKCEIAYCSVQRK